jgi:hypothetical protein
LRATRHHAQYDPERGQLQARSELERTVSRACNAPRCTRRPMRVSCAKSRQLPLQP